MSDVSRETPPVPAEVRGVFSSAVVDGLEQYAALLASQGVVRGLIGPREVPRLWTRHILNCVAPAELVAPGASVADVGSGAGLPGLVLAIVRPDLEITLVEPLLRRTTFLDEAVVALGLSARVEVVRARAQDLHGRRQFDVVTSRAVSPLARLVGWTLPLTALTGEVIAMKGAGAADEIASSAEELQSLGALPAELVVLAERVPGAGVVRVVRVRRRGPPSVS